MRKVWNFYFRGPLTVYLTGHLGHSFQSRNMSTIKSILLSICTISLSTKLFPILTMYNSHTPLTTRYNSTKLWRALVLIWFKAGLASNLSSSKLSTIIILPIKFDEPSFLKILPYFNSILVLRPMELSS